MKHLQYNYKTMKDRILQVLEKYRYANMESDLLRETLASDIAGEVKVLVEEILMEEFGVGE